jgi:Zn-dependent protease
MDGTLFQAAALIVPLILAIVFHEVAHGWVARALGDPTAEERGRLTLNPLPHVDPVGTVILPGILALANGPIFGWAKPVPVNKWRLRNPRYGMMAVAIAGPATNLLLALPAALALGLMVGAGSLEELGSTSQFIAMNLVNFLMINVFLALFNMLPIPPFDGSHIVEGLLPDSALPTWEKLRPFGFSLVFILLIGLPWLIDGFNPVAAVVIPPVEWMLGHYLALAEAVSR